MTDTNDKSGEKKDETPKRPEPAAPVRPSVSSTPTSARGISALGAFIVALIAIVAVGAGLYVTRDRWMGGIAPARDERVDQALAQAEAARKQAEELAQRLQRAADGKPADVKPADIKLNADVVALQDALKALIKEKESLAEWVTQLAAKIETMGAATAAATDPKQAQRLEQMEIQLRTLAARLSEIDKRMAQIDGLIDLLQKQSARAEQYAARMDKIEKDAEGRTGQDVRAVETARAAGLIAFSFRLRQAVDAGQPLAPTLASLQPLIGGDAAMAELLKPLQAVGESGVVTRAALTTQFSRVARLAVAADQPDEDWLSIVWRRMKQIVSVRRVGSDVQGDDAEAVIARAEAALHQGRLADAVAELDKLKDRPAREAGEWLARAKARLAAEQACDRILSEAARRLARAGDKG